jgi:hypothetical protein
MAEADKAGGKLTTWLHKAVEKYCTVNAVVDIASYDMRVISNDPETLLQTYLLLYGELKDRHGTFNHAKEYVEFMKAGKTFADLPEVTGLAARIEKARLNLEVVIKKLKPETITGKGYSLKEYKGKLMVFRETNEE